MMPLCVRCLFDGRLRRHRHCPACQAVVSGTDAEYADHAWNCPGPQAGAA